MANVRIWGITTGTPATTDVMELQRTGDGASLKATLAAVAAVLPFPASPGSDKQVLFKDATAVAGNAGLLFDKTTNTLTLGVPSSSTGVLKLAQASSAFLTTIQAGAAVAARTYIWPTDLGAAGTVLTDAAGDGVLSWGAGGGGGGTPGGSDTEVQFNNSGAFGGDPAFTFDTATKQFKVQPSTDIYAWIGPAGQTSPSGGSGPLFEIGSVAAGAQFAFAPYTVSTDGYFQIESRGRTEASIAGVYGTATDTGSGQIRFSVKDSSDATVNDILFSGPTSAPPTIWRFAPTNSNVIELGASTKQWKK